MDRPNRVLDRADSSRPASDSAPCRTSVSVVDQTREFLTGLAAGGDERRVLLIAHSANRWALEHLLHDVPLEYLVSLPFGWQPDGSSSCRPTRPAQLRSLSPGSI